MTVSLNFSSSSKWTCESTKRQYQERGKEGVEREKKEGQLTSDPRL